MSAPGEFPLSEAPRTARKGLLPISMVLFSFTFFTGTMFAGGKLGMAFNFVDMLWIAAIGNSLLALYAAALALIAARSGLNTVLMGRFCFGEAGSRLSDFLLGFAELGWYAWGTATVAIVLVKMLGLTEGLTTPLMILFGFGFCMTALIGFKGLDVLSRVSVPLMFILLLVSMYIATQHVGGLKGLAAVIPHETMTISAAITMVFGTFASGATQATNWTRLSRSGRIAVIASVVSFLLGNGLMVVAGAWCAMVYQQADIVEVMMLQGLSFAAVIMLCLNRWTIQGLTIYNVAAATCHLVRSERRRTMTLLAAAVGVVLAAGVWPCPTGAGVCPKPAALQPVATGSGSHTPPAAQRRGGGDAGAGDQFVDRPLVSRPLAANTQCQSGNSCTRLIQCRRRTGARTRCKPLPPQTLRVPCVQCCSFLCTHCPG